MSDAQVSELDGNRPLPFDRDELGRLVREAWVRWAQMQPSPKPSWLVPYDELSEADKEADRQIGEAVARWAIIGDAASRALSVTDTDWRDCFAEITAKATPLTFDEKDPERIISYAVPAGPIHRATGKMGFQFFGGEEAAKQWQQRAERAEAWRAAIEEFVTSMKETTIPEIEAAIQERQVRAADPAFRNRPLFGASPPPPQPGVRVTVKPLEWGKTSYGRPEVRCLVGTYRINEAMNGGWSATLGGINSRLLKTTDGRENFATIDEAKAAAEADYETRIRSALNIDGGAS